MGVQTWFGVCWVTWSNEINWNVSPELLSSTWILIDSLVIDLLWKRTIDEWKMVLLIMMAMMMTMVMMMTTTVTTMMMMMICFVGLHRQVKLEEGLMSSGRLNDALQSLLEWLNKAQAYLEQDQLLFGDLDSVSSLIEKHKVNYFFTEYNCFYA